MPNGQRPALQLRLQVRLAVERINADATILPHHRLVITLHQTGLSMLRSLPPGEAFHDLRSATAEQMVGDLVKEGAVAAVGAGYSSDNLALGPHLAASSLPIISHSATAGFLSNSSAYHLRNITIMLRSLDWLRFTYVFENRPA